jgi:hypothetical protein
VVRWVIGWVVKHTLLGWIPPQWAGSHRAPGLSDAPNVQSGYRASYSTQYNQIGRQFVGGVNGGGFNSQNYLLTR